MTTRPRTPADLSFLGVSGALVTFGAASRHDPARTNRVSLDTATGAIRCDCAAAKCGRACWHAATIEAAWQSQPAMRAVRWLTDEQLARYGRKRAAMVAIYRARIGRAHAGDEIALAAARDEWRLRHPAQPERRAA